MPPIRVGTPQAPPAGAHQIGYGFPVVTTPTPGGVPRLDGNGQMSASFLRKQAGYQFAYQEFTSPVTISATASGSADTIVTAPKITTDGFETIRIEFYAPEILITQNASGNACKVYLFEDGSVIGELGRIRDDSGNNQISAPFNVARQFLSAKGDRTYSVRAIRSNANATVNAGAGGSTNFMPGFLRIVRV